MESQTPYYVRLQDSTNMAIIFFQILLTFAVVVTFLSFPLNMKQVKYTGQGAIMVFFEAVRNKSY